MNVFIYQVQGGWTLKIGHRELFYSRLVYAIEAANLLKVHVRNVKSLPVGQYKIETDVKVSMYKFGPTR